ncbi:putative cytokine receptor common subunit beta [Triplophysa rosa]|uniref:Cytokine receptor common subunit beta n=1 Tax=Triplophysa rosa TaxID=992332 RepID=A0A9W7T737_TRIRA|nr:putative cytokine receptor common subunit beta [Triplophysa rosa]
MTSRCPALKEECRRAITLHITCTLTQSCLMEVDVIHQSANDKLNKNETEGSGMLFDRPTLMSDYELPGPTNLRCVYRGERNGSCSWELTTDVAQYISYTLSYRTHSSSLGEWCCVDNVEVTNARGLLRMVGVFSIFEPGALEVQLTPTPVTRVIHAYKHIQPACPTGLCVELSREDWILNWTLPKYRTIRLTSQLEYWSISSPKDVKTISLPDPVTVISIPERSVIGSSEYRARVRCSLSKPRRPGQRYAGYPSEWTDPVSWTTQPEPLVPRLVAFVLYFLIATLSAAVSVVVFFILVVMQRRLRDWNASLPSPVHSKVSKVRQLPQRDLLTRELKDPDISSVQIVGVCPRPSSLLSDAVLPCSEGYMQNPATSTDTTQSALQALKVCLSREQLFVKREVHSENERC